jgi:hypothetical protein
VIHAFARARPSGWLHCALPFHFSTAAAVRAQVRSVPTTSHARNEFGLLNSARVSRQKHPNNSELAASISRLQ